MDIEAVRSETPGCGQRLHFNNAGASLMPRRVLERVRSHLELEARIGGYEAADEQSAALEAVYRLAARLVGGAEDEIALFENATRAWNAIFYALSFEPGERILTGRAEYCSNYMAYLQVAGRTGAEIVVVEDNEAGEIDVDRLAAAIDERTKLISLTHVPTSGGLVNPAAEVGRIAREAGVLFLLDACQSVGQLPIDVGELGCDFLSTTGRKFLRAPRGTAFLYIARRRLDEVVPAQVEVGAAAWTKTQEFTWKDGAHRFETWEASHALRLGLGSAIDYALELGVEQIWERVEALGEALRQRLAEIPGATVHDLGRTRCGIVTFSLRDVEAEQLCRGLLAQGVNVDVSLPEDTRLDFEARRLPPMIRASVHYFNTEDEITDFCAAVERVSFRSEVTAA